MAEVARKGVDDFKIRCENIVVGEVVKDIQSKFDFGRLIYLIQSMSLSVVPRVSNSKPQAELMIDWLQVVLEYETSL